MASHGLVLNSENSVDGMNNPIADWQVKVHHKGLVVQSRLKKYKRLNVKCVIGLPTSRGSPEPSAEPSKIV